MRLLPERNIFLNQSGVAAIFVVIFFALLIGIITLSFATIANQDQQRSTNNDLAQSAYDSSQAGIEDGRRLLAAYYKCLQEGKVCNNNVDAAAATLSAETKQKYESIFNKDDCSAIAVAEDKGLINIDGNISGNVVSVESGSGGDLQQAYTCVNIKTKTPDYQTSLQANQSRLIPLSALSSDGNSSAYPDKATLSWFMKRDSGSGDEFKYDYTKPTTPNPLTLPASNWGDNTPSLIRVQIIPVASSVNVSPAAVNDGSRTIFLYPKDGGSTSSVDINSDTIRRVSKINTPVLANGCVVSKDATAYGFACKADLTGFLADGSTKYYLRVTPLYNKSTVNITLHSGGTSLLFDNVQPTIDSTGRANDLYRRSFTRMNPININEVTFDADFTSTDSICKDYSVGGSTSDFNAGSCN